MRFTARSIYAQSDIFISPLCLATSLLLLFSFALGHIQDSHKAPLLTAISFVISLLSVTWFLNKAFTSLKQDSAYEHLRLAPVCSTKLFASYLTLTFGYALIASFFTVFLASLFFELPFLEPNIVPLCIALTLYGLSISALGILCAAISAKSEDNHIIFSLIYFTLSTPLALGALLYYEEAITHTDILTNRWLWLLLLEGVLLILLSTVLFKEIHK